MQALNLYVEHGFSPLEEVDAAISAAFARVQDSASGLQGKEGITAAGERRSPVRDGLAVQKTPKAHRHTRLPSTKTLTAEIDALLVEKNAGYTEYPERKRRANKLLTVK